MSSFSSLLPKEEGLQTEVLSGVLCLREHHRKRDAGLPDLCPHAPRRVMGNQPPSMGVKEAMGEKLRCLLAAPSVPGEMG